MHVHVPDMHVHVPCSDTCVVAPTKSGVPLSTLIDFEAIACYKECIISSASMSLRQFFSLSFLVVHVLVRCKAGEYDPSGRIYPWPLPTDRQPLFFGLIVSFGETFNSSGVVPGVNVALDIINSNESQLLDGYSLHYVLSDSQVSPFSYTV